MKNIKFYKQKGVPSFFKRRNPKQSKINLKNTNTINKLYDFLRMLDAPDYPNAYIRLNKFKFSFNNIKLFKNKVYASIEIIKK